MTFETVWLATPALADADWAEHTPESRHQMIKPVYCALHEVNPEYVPQLEMGGVRSKSGQPHPFIGAFVRAAQARAQSASA